jgi:hypothetical protein
MMNKQEIEACRAKLVERIHQLHAYVQGMHALPRDLEDAVRRDTTLEPNEREGLLRLFFLTSQHWTIWQYKDGTMHKGMAFVTGAIDMEFYETEYPPEARHLDFDMPTTRAPKGREWRRGTFDLMGHDVDEAPLDVVWTPEQIGWLEDSDRDFV